MEFTHHANRQDAALLVDVTLPHSVTNTMLKINDTLLCSPQVGSANEIDLEVSLRSLTVTSCEQTLGIPLPLSKVTLPLEVRCT